VKTVAVLRDGAARACIAPRLAGACRRCKRRLAWGNTPLMQRLWAFSTGASDPMRVGPAGDPQLWWSCSPPQTTNGPWSGPGVRSAPTGNAAEALLIAIEAEAVALVEADGPERTPFLLLARAMAPWVVIRGGGRPAVERSALPVGSAGRRGQRDACAPRLAGAAGLCCGSRP